MRNPRATVDNPKKREKEKIKLALEWIACFHVTTLPVLAKRLDIHENTAFRFVRKLKKKGFIRSVPVSTVRREILILTNAGVELCSELCNKLLIYKTEPSKINVGRIRHDLNVQMAILNRLGQGAEFYFGKDLDFIGIKKLPDAIVGNNGSKLALEIELNPKTDERIYRGFASHVKALMAHKFYDHVEYIFKNKALEEYYRVRFNENAWPVYKWNGKSRKWLELKKRFYPKEHGVIEKFSFAVEKLYNE